MFVWKSYWLHSDIFDLLGGRKDSLKMILWVNDPIITDNLLLNCANTENILLWFDSIIIKTRNFQAFNIIAIKCRFYDLHAGTSNFTIFRTIIFFWNFLWPWREYSHWVKRSWHFFTNVSNSVGLLNDFFVNKTIFDEIPLAWQATRVVCRCYVCSMRLQAGSSVLHGIAYWRAMGMHMGAKGGDWQKKRAKPTCWLHSTVQ